LIKRINSLLQGVTSLNEVALKRGLKGLDKTIFLSIVGHSVFILCSNTTKIREILIGYTLLFAAYD